MGISAIYARQSVEKKNSLSIAGQVELCRKLAGDAPVKVYRDKGYSGKNADRPAFRRLLEDVKRGSVDRILVYRLDRFSRSVADFSRIWQVLQAQGVEFVSVSEQFDTASPMGRAMLHIITVFAQLERETTAERVRDNCRLRAAAGNWTGGPAPYGYDLSGTALRPNGQAETVQRIFQRYASDGVSLSALARELNAETIPGSGRKTWDSAALSRVLHNSIYVKTSPSICQHFQGKGVEIATDPLLLQAGCSCRVIGQKKKPSFAESTESFSDGTLVSLNCPGLIPGDLWLRCQEKLSHNRQIGNTGKGTHTWLSGLLKCACCGYSLKVLTDHKGGCRLVCSGRYNKACCKASIRVRPEAIEASAAAALEVYCALAQPSDRASAIAAEQASIRHSIQRLLSAFSSGDSITLPYLQQELHRLENRRLALAEEKAAMHSASSCLPVPSSTFSVLSFDEKKSLAHSLLSRIAVSETAWQISFHSSALSIKP